jgi:hypothetical protein
MSLSLLKRNPVFYLDRVSEEVVVFQKGSEDPNVVRDASGRYVALPGSAASREREWVEEFSRRNRLPAMTSEAFPLHLAGKPRLLARWRQFKSEKLMAQMLEWAREALRETA